MKLKQNTKKNEQISFDHIQQEEKSLQRRLLVKVGLFTEIDYINIPNRRLFSERYGLVNAESIEIEDEKRSELESVLFGSTNIKWLVVEERKQKRRAPKKRLFLSYNLLQGQLSLVEC